MNRAQVNMIYDKFPEPRNMSRQEFVRQVLGLTSQKNIQTDLAGIQEEKARRRSMEISNTRKINRALH